MVFRPALAPLEAAMLPARERPHPGALAHLKRELARSFGNAGEGRPLRSARKDLGQIDKAALIDRHADAGLCIAGGENVLSVAGR